MHQEIKLHNSTLRGACIDTIDLQPSARRLVQYHGSSRGLTEKTGELRKTTATMNHFTAV